MPTEAKPAEQIWHALRVSEVLRVLESSSSGLDPDEAARRLARDGANELSRQRAVSAWRVFVRQFASALIIVLIVAAVLAAFVGEYVDAVVIMGAVAVNALVGFIQERKAERALEEIRKFVQYYARVVRGSSELRVPSQELVRGDVVRLSSGDRVPADLRLLTATDVETNEAPLTGESNPVSKTSHVLPPGLVLAERVNMLYQGTVVVGGEALGVVTSAGKATELGKLATLLTEIPDEPTPLKEKLEGFGRAIGVIVAVCLVLLLGIGLLLKYPFRDMFTLSVAIGVSAVPEGLAVVVTAILALGMRRILKRQALVRKLMAAETLGSTTVICVDKTGTLTAGEMRVVRVMTPDEELHPASDTFKDGSSAMALLRVGTLSNHAYIENPHDGLTEPVVVGLPTEQALVLAAQQVGIDIESLRRQHPMVAEVPFNSDRKFMVSLHEFGQKQRLAYLKGSPEAVLAACNHVRVFGKHRALSGQDRHKFMREAEARSSEGLRILALAERELPAKATIKEAGGEQPEQFTFLGFVALQDPLRAKVRETVQAAWRAGVRVVMITGDHKLTAQAIAKEAGLPSGPDNVIEGSELMSWDDAKLREEVARVSVFARAVPSDKLRIISAWQARGEVVAMTGDGVNDAPALRAADIGVALGSGSDVAKEASDMVLLDNNVSTIVAAVEEGRTIYSNIRKVVLYLVSDSFSEVLLMVGAFLAAVAVGEPLGLPVLATQILWINFITDSFPAIALASDPANHSVMEQPPVKRNEPVLDASRKLVVGVVSILKGFGALGVYLFLLAIGCELPHIRTVVFTLMAFTSLGYVFSCKHLHHSIFHPMTWNNKSLLVAVGFAVALQIGVVYMPWGNDIFHTVPLAAVDWLLVLSFCCLAVFLMEGLKYFAWGRRSHASSTAA